MREARGVETAEGGPSGRRRDKIIEEGRELLSRRLRELAARAEAATTERELAAIRADAISAGESLDTLKALAGGRR